MAANVPHPSGILTRLRPIAKAPQRAAQKPSDMLISRTGLFYCATFPSRPGLPSSREPLHLPLSKTQSWRNSSSTEIDMEGSASFFQGVRMKMEAKRKFSEG